MSIRRLGEWSLGRLKEVRETASDKLRKEILDSFIKIFSAVVLLMSVGTCKQFLGFFVSTNYLRLQLKSYLQVIFKTLPWITRLHIPDLSHLIYLVWNLNLIPLPSFDRFSPRIAEGRELGNIVSAFYLFCSSEGRQ